MEYRVYNTEKKCWIKNVFLDCNGELFVLKRCIFGLTKPYYLSPDEYICHKAINLNDKDGMPVYEGDYIEAKVSDDRTVIGLVCYAEELSAYVILCADSNEFFTLGSEVCDYIKVIGNVFDGYEEGEQNGQQTLQDEKIS